MVLDPDGGAASSSPKRSSLHSRKGSNWSRTRACSPKRRDWSNGRSVLLGAFDQDFLQIPEEVIRATIRNNQKCFVLRDGAHAKLVNRFLFVVN